MVNVDLESLSLYLLFSAAEQFCFQTIRTPLEHNFTWNCLLLVRMLRCCLFCFCFVRKIGVCVWAGMRAVAYLVCINYSVTCTVVVLYCVGC